MPNSGAKRLIELKYLIPLQETEPRITLITMVADPRCYSVLLLSYECLELSEVQVAMMSVTSACPTA
jgi:hypothetical protein